jgi:alkylation response protein AidB-like acyl-CoA dehydrogenase
MPMRELMTADAADLAEAVATAADRTFSDPPPWRPGVAQDDASEALTSALADMGWLDLAADPALLGLVAPAAAELGRRLAPLDVLDALLGAGPMAGDLVRGGAAHGVDRDLVVHEIVAAEPVAYGDAIGVRRVRRRRPAGTLDPAALDAWVAANAGYLAGLSAWALELAVDYAKGRKAFGATLAALAPVQQRLADAATDARGVELLARDAPGRAALAYAGAAAVEVTAACQQVVGAIGYTLEFPLQRAFRRARGMQLWADALLLP